MWVWVFPKTLGTQADVAASPAAAQTALAPACGAEMMKLTAGAHVKMVNGGLMMVNDWHLKVNDGY